MRPSILLCLVVVLLCSAASAGPFVLFPKAGELASPDGRFVVRDADRDRPISEFTGSFHSLWLVEPVTGRSRKLCDYLGTAAVAWSDSEFLVVTEYVARKTSRALVFAVSRLDEPVLLDKATLLQLLGPEFRETLRQNDHVFVEASRLEEGTLHLRVWGYGRVVSKAFRWSCKYSLREGGLSCTE